jgi:hypothetical protein
MVIGEIGSYVEAIRSVSPVALIAGLVALALRLLHSYKMRKLITDNRYREIRKPKGETVLEPAGGVTSPMDDGPKLLMPLAAE